MKKSSNKNTALKVFGGLVAGISAMHIVPMLTTDRILKYTDIMFFSPKISNELDGYRIAFLTDVHFMEYGELEKACKKISRKNIDAVLVGGDFAEPRIIVNSQLKLISSIKNSDGIYAVDGNHDEVPYIYNRMLGFGIKPLINSGLRLRDNLYLCGVEDFRERNPDVDSAVSGADDEDFVLLLSHNPDIAAFKDMSRVDLMLSGHTHGGQANFFGAYSPLLQIIGKTGQRFRTGFSKLDKGSDKSGYAYVSNGMGTHHSAPRVLARPEVIFLTLKSEK